MRNILFLVSIFFAALNLEAKNPIDSPTFKDILKEYIGDQKYIFDDKNIDMKVPSFADNPVQVPIYVNGSKIKDAQEMIIFADLNPIPKVIKMKTDNFLPIFSTNIKVAQETPLRALIKDSTGLWHIGSININSNGGGCDISSQASADSEYAESLGKSKGKIFNKKEQKRVKFSIFHPMETGLVFGNVAFYIKKIEIRDKENQLLGKISTSAAISENPRITLETKKDLKELNLMFFDNDANEFELKL